MDEFLFIGGPKHGIWLRTSGEAVYKVLATADPSDNPLPIFAVSGLNVHSYIKRELVVTDPAGAEYTRCVYVHSGIPSPEFAQALLGDLLLYTFVRNGGEHTNVRTVDFGAAGNGDGAA